MPFDRKFLSLRVLLIVDHFVTDKKQLIIWRQICNLPKAASDRVSWQLDNLGAIFEAFTQTESKDSQKIVSVEKFVLMDFEALIRWQHLQKALSLLSILFSLPKIRINTIAEGVETREQVNQLKTLGCEFAQGYLYAKPTTVRDIESTILDKKRV